MAHHSVAILLLILALASGCAAKKPPERPAPGQMPLSSAEAVRKELGCEGRKTPLLVLETNEARPAVIRPGQEIHHHMVYAFCPGPAGTPATARLTRTVYAKNRQVLADTDPAFEIRPGRWSVVAYIQTPENAPAGDYELETECRPDPSPSGRDQTPSAVKNRVGLRIHPGGTP